jgi:DNA invertase Pin-like site-specific DNA recombinase
VAETQLLSNGYAQNLDKNRPRKIVFYGRVSTEHEQQLAALQNQMQWYDDQLRYHPNWELVGKYIDEGITGTQARKRPQFLRMIEDAQNQEFDLIVTREVCRFARNTVDTLIYTRKLKGDLGIEVYFVEDNIWTMDGDGELRLTIMATLAQEESRKTSERVKAGQYISRQNGVLYGNGNILGYDRAGNTYVINEGQAETVRLIFDLYLSGLGTMKIAKELERQKRKDASGNVKWNAAKVARILKRSTYKGVMAYNQSQVNNYLEQKRVNNYDRDTYMYVQGNYPPIISPEDWNKVQRIIESRTVSNTLSDRKTGKKPTNDIWLRKLECKCGSKFRRNKWRTNKTGEECFGYQCYNQVNNGSKTFRAKNGLNTDGYCDIKMIADWKLNFMAKEIIGSVWQNQSESILTAYRMVAENYIEEPSQQQKNMKSIKKKIEKLRKKSERLIEMRADGEINKTEYLSMKKNVEEQLLELEADLDSYKEEHQTQKSLDDKLQEIKTIFDTTIDFSQQKLDDYIIDRFIYKVVPISNKLFRWYIKLTDDDTPPNEICLGVEGRKNNPKIIDENGRISLPSYQRNTGCCITKIGEFFIYNFVIPYELARCYRKTFGSYLRFNQWEDITIEVYIKI